MLKKILILEDEEVLGRLYEKKLKKADFKVKWIRSIKELDQALLELKPDIVLLDNSISGEELSGMDTIPQIRESVPNAKIVMLSNYSDFHLKEKALETGADDYLVKIDNSPQKLVKYIEKDLL